VVEILTRSPKIMAHISEDKKCPKHGSEKHTEFDGHSYARSYSWTYRYCTKCDIRYKAGYIKGCREK